MRKWLKRGALTLLGVTVLAVAAWVGSFYYLEHALRKEIAQLRADKILLTYDELVPPAPDAENAAPVLRELVRTIVPPLDDLPRPSIFKAELESNSEGMARLADWTRKNEHVFSGMKDVIAKPQYRMEHPLLLLDIYNPDDKKIPLANLFKLYEAKIYLLFKNKNIGDAANYIIDYLKFCILYKKSCTSFSEYITTLVYSGMTIGYVDAIVSNHEITGAQLDGIAVLLNALDIPQLIKQAIQGELIFEYSVVLSLANKDLSVLFSPKVLKALYFYQHDGIFRDAPQYIEIATSPFYMTRDKIDRLKEKHQSDLIPGHYTQIFPDNAFYPATNIISRLDILRLKLAILRHMAKHRKLPASLQEIDTSILPTVPRDAYNGKEYTYAIQGEESFMVSSETYELNTPEYFRIQPFNKKTASAPLANRP